MKTIKNLFGQNIKLRRSELGMSGEALAEKIDMSITQVYRIENGSSWPTSETIEKIAKKLNVPVSSLFVDESSNTQLIENINVKNALGKKIQLRRIELGYNNQQSLADILNVDRSQISRWESGQNTPEGAYRVELCRVLKVDETFFQTIHCELNNRTYSRILNKTKQELLSLVIGLDDNKASDVLEILKIFIKHKP